MCQFVLELRPYLTVQFFLQLATQFYTLRRCKNSKYTFPSQFATLDISNIHHKFTSPKSRIAFQ